MKVKASGFFLLLLVMLISSAVSYSQYNWSKYEGNPVFSGGGSGQWDKHVFEPMILFNPDSIRYEMYYNGSYGPGTPGWRPFRIGVAYSSDGISWNAEDNPVLVPDAGTWDETSVERPWVVRENGSYKMWYYGWAAAGPQIGYATSPDGINWTKHSTPVLSKSSAPWEKDGVVCPSIIVNDTGSYKYTMYYSGVQGVSSYYVNKNRTCILRRWNQLDKRYSK